MSLEEALALMVNGRFPVHDTPKRHFYEVDFYVDDEVIRGLEQNPETASR